MYVLLLRTSPTWPSKDGDHTSRVPEAQQGELKVLKLTRYKTMLLLPNSARRLYKTNHTMQQQTPRERLWRERRKIETVKHR